MRNSPEGRYIYGWKRVLSLFDNEQRNINFASIFVVLTKLQLLCFNVFHFFFFPIFIGVNINATYWKI